MRSSQLFSFSVPVGMAVPMPALAAAGTPSFTTASNELYVNNSSATITPQSSCSPLLPAVVGATNDVSYSATQTSLVGFQNIANVLASGYSPSNVGLAYQSTKPFYVNGVYYFFGPSSANALTLSWTSSTDLVNFTPAVPVTPCAPYNIVDIAYYSGAWVFLDANGVVLSMTDPGLFTGLTITELPMLATAGGYRNIVNINAVWYVIGGSSAGGGYRVSTSTNLSAWTVAIDSGGSGGGAISICQGAGSGAATEILVGCASDTILKSTNNGATFAAVATATGLGSTTLVKHVMYSSRTAKYYLAISSNATTSGQVCVAVSSTGTLATATFTTTYGAGTGLYASQLPLTMVDTGTNVGVCFTSNNGAHYFWYGASFATNSTAILTAAQMQSPYGTNATGYAPSAKSWWINGLLITICGGQSSQPAILANSAGATCSTGLAISLYFPMAANAGASTWNVQWSGLTYLSGSYYAVNGTAYYSGSTFNYFWAFLYKLNAALTLLSCPVAPIPNIYTGTISYPANIGISAGRLNGAGTGINWVGYLTNNGGSQNFSTIFTFNGTTFTTSQVTSATAGSGGYQSNMPVNGQPASCLALPKWSSLLNTYVMALPCVTADSATGYSALVVTSATLSGAPASTLVSSGNASASGGQINMLDVLSNGMVVVLASYYSSPYWQYTLTLNNGTQNIALAGSTAISNYAMWEIDYGGYVYLACMLGASLYVWRLASTSAPIPVISALTVPLTISTPISTTLRRVFSYNGSFLLGDSGTQPTTTRNSIALTPSNGTFTVTPAELYVPGDINYAGVANTTTTQNTVTVVNSTPVPSVFLPAGAAGNFTKVR
jgi:hypothetical protein